jgi:hypothetical protein
MLPITITVISLLFIYAFNLKKKYKKTQSRYIDLQCKNDILHIKYKNIKQNVDRINFRLKQNFRYKRYYNIKYTKKRNPCRY